MWLWSWEIERRPITRGETDRLFHRRIEGRTERWSRFNQSGRAPSSRWLWLRCIATGAFAAGHGIPAFLHVRRGDGFEQVLEHPLVAVRVGHAAAAEAVELIGRGHEHGGTRRDGAVERGIGVFHHHAKRDRRAAEGGRRLVAPLRIFLREHDEAALDQEFGMDDPAGFFVGEPVALGGSEGGFVESDGLRRIAYA
jgi:hypothetical protein